MQTKGYNAGLADFNTSIKYLSVTDATGSAGNFKYIFSLSQNNITSTNTSYVYGVHYGQTSGTYSRCLCVLNVKTGDFVVKFSDSCTPSYANGEISISGMNSKGCVFFWG